MKSSDIALKNEFEIEYKKKVLRLFTYSSKTSLNAVILNNGNTYASLLAALSVHLEESYENLDVVLNKINYSDHNQIIGWN